MTIDYRASFGKTLFGVKNDDPDDTPAMSCRASLPVDLIPTPKRLLARLPV